MLDVGMTLNLIANALMDGVCCMPTVESQEKQKKEQNEMLRRAVKIEWERHKLIEREEQERILREQGLDAATVMADERRRIHMATKYMASQASQASQRSSRANSVSDQSLDFAQTRPTAGYADNRNDEEDQKTVPDTPTPQYHFADDGFAVKQECVGRSRSAPSNNGRRRRGSHQRASQQRGGVPLAIVASPSMLSMESSLLDADDSEEEFDEILLK